MMVQFLSIVTVGYRSQLDHDYPLSWPPHMPRRNAWSELRSALIIRGDVLLSFI